MLPHPSPEKDQEHRAKKRQKSCNDICFSDDDDDNDEAFIQIADVNGFDDDDDDDFECLAGEVDVAYKVSPPPLDSTERYYRMVVESSIKFPDKILLTLSPVQQVQNKTAGNRYVAHLLHDWADLVIPKDTVVNVIGLFDDFGSITIDSLNNWIVVNPDILLTGTMISTSFMCQRRSIIADMFRVTSYSSVMIVGTLLHELFQATMNDSASIKSWDSLLPKAEQIIGQYLLDIYAADMTEQQVLDEMRSVYPGFKWFHDSMFSRSKHHPTVQHRDSRMKNTHISEVLDIEENVWSPMYGLKGKIDVTAEALIDNQRSIVPVEIKTGRNNSTSSSTTSHRAQTSLYTLMLSDRYGVGVEFGLLYYMRSNEILLVPSIRDEIKGLIIARNQLSQYVINKEKLPPVISEDYMCSKCFANQACAVLHKVTEQGTSETFGCTVFDQFTEYLSEKQIAFMNKWLNLLLLEDRTMSVRPIINTENSLSITVYELSNPALCQYKLFSNSDTLGSFLESGFNVNDHVIIHVCPSAFGYASGFIESISCKNMSIKLDRRLPPNKEIKLDKYQLSFGLSLLRGNLLQLLCSENNSRAMKLSKLIVEHVSPAFETNTLDLDVKRYPYLKELNSCQLEAIKRVVQSKDYTLLFGMPGTGKTTAVVTLIRFLVDTGNSVIVSSYTNTALDNILIKYKEFSNDFVRLGSRTKVQESLQENIPEGNPNITCLKQLELLLSSVPVVGVTCLGINHPIFTKRSFTFCIIDEAAQIMMPACIGPLLSADKFVLVGDPYQLPPVVQSREAAKQGLDISLFQMLYESHPEAVCELKTQYRMNRDIMKLANIIFYSNKLVMGSCKVENQKLTLESFVKSDWVSMALDPTKSVVFIDTDKFGCTETVQNSGLLVNTGEAEVVEQIVKSAVQLGLDPSKIAVISQYRAQLKILSLKLKNFQSKLEIFTVDKFQGRDKDLILMSFVRSNNASQVGDLLKDWRRLNVAITRAKCKLILIGSCSTLRSETLYDNMLKVVADIGQIVSIPPVANVDQKENIQNQI